jgi:hypothetical protein
MRGPDDLRLDSGREMFSQVYGDGTMNSFLGRRPGLISAMAVLRDTVPEYGVDVSRPYPWCGR